MELNYNNLIEIIPFKFKTYYGKDIIKLLVNDKGTDIVSFYTKKGLLMQVREIMPDVDEDDLKLFYFYYRGLLFKLYRFFRSYKNDKRAQKLYPNYEFKYEKSYDVNDRPIGVEFEILNNVVLPIDDPFWRIYYPPNFLNDNSTVRNTDKDVRDFERNMAPVVSQEFQIDFFELYDANYFKFEDTIVEGKPFVTVNLNTNDIFMQSLYKIANKHGVSNEEVDEIMNQKKLQ
jgi:hypothetical protein